MEEPQEAIAQRPNSAEGAKPVAGGAPQEPNQAAEEQPEEDTQEGHPEEEDTGCNGTCTVLVAGQMTPNCQLTDVMSAKLCHELAVAQGQLLRRKAIEEADEAKEASHMELMPQHLSPEQFHEFRQMQRSEEEWWRLKGQETRKRWELKEREE